MSRDTSTSLADDTPKCRGHPHALRDTEVEQALDNIIRHGRPRLHRTWPEQLSTGAVAGTEVALGVLALRCRLRLRPLAGMVWLDLAGQPGRRYRADHAAPADPELPPASRVAISMMSNLSNRRPSAVETGVA
jgi:hypothetical protein